MRAASEFPLELAVAAPSQFLYVANASDSNASAVDTNTDAVVGTPITVGSVPRKFAVLPNGTKAYVAKLGNSVSVIDTISRAVTASLSTGASSQPSSITVSPGGTKAYLATFGCGGRHPQGG
ncbi:YncE family protein [Streptomyces sp. NPDC127084]|uniref:YncE family protein n=1 Tax=Streptomyces sp. NPDC127084 TaxID=3347133 RepID=UPI00364EECFA